MVSSDFLKAIVIMCFLFGAQQGSGINVVTFYTVNLLQQTSLSLDEQAATILIDLVRLIASFLAFYFINPMKRRTLFFSSATHTVLSLITIVAALHYQMPNTVFIFAICWYTISVFVGVVPVSWIMSAEVRNYIFKLID